MRWPRRRWMAALAVTIVAAALWLRLGPVDPSLLNRSRFESTTVVDRNGVVLYEPLASSGTRGSWLTPEQVPERVAAATIAAEDHRFYRHLGVDPFAVGRAVLHDVRAMRMVEGGSTITQQVAKMLLGDQKRSVSAKVREAVLALRLEHRYTKREILAMYLNLAPYGNQVNGVARASRVYFGCDPANLTTAQAAFLASLPQRPGAFNPLRDPKRARARQLYVLARMSLPADELAHAKAERLDFDRGVHAAFAQHFVERVLERTPHSPRIVTTLDAELQKSVQGILSAQKDNLLKHGAHSAAVVVLDNHTGEWLVWEGSGDYFGTTFGGAIDGVVTPRQPGSALKPFTYALGFERGESPATVLADVPSHFPTAEEGVVYTPRNYDGRYRGPLTVRAALAGSENVPAVAMLHKLGPPSLLRLLRNAGFHQFDKTADYYGLGLTLGDAEVTLEEMVTAYAAFARDGNPVHPTFLHGQRTTDNGQPLFSPRTAFWITDILSDDRARAYIFGEGGSLSFPFPVAVKTGTSSAYRDNWTVGYTRDVTVGVWVGNFDRQELRNSSGVTGAAPIFNAVMLATITRLHGSLPIGDATPIVAPPADVEPVRICALSGMRPSPYCPDTITEWLPTHTPARFCTWHHQDSIDWPAEYRSWAHVPTAPIQTVSHRNAPLKVTNPADGATYLIDPTLRSEYQTLKLRAAASSHVTWKVDARELGTVPPGGAVEWPLRAGEHVITASDANGHRDSVTIYVK